MCCQYVARIGSFYPRAVVVPKRKRLNLNDILLANLIKLHKSRGVTIALLLSIIPQHTLPLNTRTSSSPSPTFTTASPTRAHENFPSLPLGYFITFCLWMSLVLLRAGDIAENPGPHSDISSISSESDFSSISSESVSNVCKNQISFVHYNIQSINNKIDILSAELLDYDIISLTETWLNDESEIPETTLDNFKTPYTHIRSNQVGGGVSVYVKSNIYSIRRPDLEVRCTESVWVELIIKNKRILYGTFYRPPNSTPETWDLLEHSVDLAYNTGIDYIIITGDLNEDQLNPNNIRIKNIIMKYGFEQLIEEPTHYTETNSSLLDIIISSGNNIVKKAYVSEHFLPAITRYHCPIVGLLNVQKPILKSFKRKKGRDLTQSYDKSPYTNRNVKRAK